MAKIVFFTESLPPQTDAVGEFSYELIRSLAEQGHEIRVFTTYRPGTELPKQHARIQILQPFRRWSLLELPRLLALLLSDPPEILHVVQPRHHANRRFSGLLNSLGPLAQMLGRPPLVVSLFDFSEADLKRHAVLIALSDALTVSTEPQLSTLKEYLQIGRPWTRRRPQLEKVPVSASDPVAQVADPQPAGEQIEAQAGAELAYATVKRFCDTAEKLILLPLELRSDLWPALRQLCEFLRAHAGVRLLIAGGWGQTPPDFRHRLTRKWDEMEIGQQIFLCGRLPTTIETEVFARSQIILLGLLNAHDTELTRLIRLSLKVEGLLILRSRDLQDDPFELRETMSVMTLQDSLEDLKVVLEDALRCADGRPLQRAQSREFSRRQAQDLPANTVSRLYARLLER